MARTHVLAALLLLGAAAAAWYYLRPLEIDGYTGRTTYAPGDTANVHISASRSDGEALLQLYTVTGDVVDSMAVAVRPQRVRTKRPWAEGFGYDVTFTYPVPALESGVYLWENRIPFVIREDAREAEIVVVYPSNTIAAYNMSGGKNLYLPSRTWRIREALIQLITLQWDEILRSPSEDRAIAVSFQRPGNLAQWNYFRPFLEWMHTREAYEVAYISDQDLDDYASFGSSRLLVVMGHSEYWTRKARRNFDRFVAQGGSALVLSGNTMWWQVRYDATKTKLICYRRKALDPVAQPGLETVRWNDESLDYPIWKSIGAQFDLGGYGLREDQGWNGYRIVRPDSPLMEGVDLSHDSILSLPTAEYDGTWLAGLTPEGHPMPDTARMGFHEMNLIGYDYGSRDGMTVGTFIAFRKTPDAGVVVNAGSTNWCSDTGFDGRDSTALRTITANAIERLLRGETVFAPHLAAGPTAP